MTTLGPVLLVLVLALPLAMALAAPFLDRPLRLLPWAAVPGLLAALTVGPGTGVDVPVIVLGLSLAVDQTGAIFLGVGSLLWLLAGHYARSYMADSARQKEFSAFWLVTLAGTLGTFVAADIVTFYMSFSLMSLASYALVVHDRTAVAWRAGRIYIVLAVFGETALLAAVIVAATAADTLAIADVRAGVAASPWRDWAVAGFVAGFGMKAGLVPLHVWLPLAHPQAPTPASAVLSGVIVKAGIIGLIRFVSPDGGAGWSETLVLLGLVTTFYGALVGLAQGDAKALLAYSTLSQMGVLVTVIGTALGAPDAAPAQAAISLYAAHHGLAKGALFLGIGVVAASGRAALRWIMPVVALMALAIAGLPLTGGALAKIAIKDPLGDGMAGTLVTVSAVTTALLMLRFVWLQATAERRDESPPLGLVLPWAATVAAALVLPWVLFPDLSGHPAVYALSLENLWSGLWPILLALAVAALAFALKVPAVTLPQGDIVVIAEAAARAVRSAWGTIAGAMRNLPRPHFSSAVPGRFIGVVEQRSEQWSVVGPVLLLIVLIGAALL
jgi:hydrogenase-4 component B